MLICRAMSAANPTLPTPKAKSGLAALSAAHFLNDGAANFLPGVLPAILIALHAPVALAGVLMGALLIGQALQPLTGWLADRIGGRRQIALALFATSALGMGVGAAPSMWTLILCLLCLGIANSFFHPPALAATRRIAVSRPGHGTSFFLVGGEIGRGIWPLAASGVVTVLGLGWLWVLAIPGLLMACFSSRWIPRTKPQPATTAPVRWTSHLRPMRRIVAVAALRSLMILAPITFLPILWAQRGASLGEGAATITAILIVGIVGNMGGGVISDRLGRKPVLIIALVAALGFLAAILLAPDVWWIWLLLAGYGIAIYATLPLTVLMAQDLLPDNPAMGSGLALGFANALSAVGVMLLGPLAAFSSVQTVLWITFAGGVFAVILAGRLAAPTR